MVSELYLWNRNLHFFFLTFACLSFSLFLQSLFTFSHLLSLISFFSFLFSHISPYSLYVTMTANTAHVTDRSLSLTQIKAHIPITLDMNQMNYDIWRELFETHCLSFTVLSHLDGSSLPTGLGDTLWNQTDGTIKMWIYRTIYESLFKTVLKTKCTSRELWTTIENLFRDNKEAHTIQLENEIWTLQIRDLSVNDYCQKLKTLSDLLANVNFSISERTLVMHLLNVLSSKFDNIINVMMLSNTEHHCAPLLTPNPCSKMKKTDWRQSGS